MQFNLIRNRNRQTSQGGAALSLCLFLIIALILGWLLSAFKFIFLPVVLALFGTFLLSPPVEWLYRRKVPRPVGIIVTLVLAALIGLIGVQYLTSSIISFQGGFPKYEDRIKVLLSQAKTLKEIRLPFTLASSSTAAPQATATLPPPLPMDTEGGSNGNISETEPAAAGGTSLGELAKAVLSGLSISGLVGSTLSSFFNIVIYLLLTLLFMLYFLPAFPNMPKKFLKAFPGTRGHLLCRAFENIGKQVQSYIWAKTLTSLITGVGVALPCLFFGVDFAITWGVFAAILNFIPTIGTILSVIPPILVCSLQPELGGLSTTIWLAAILCLVMTVTGNVLEPLMLGQSVNLSPTASLVALFFWGWLWGGIGMLIAVPAMAIVKLTCDNIDGLKPVGAMLGN